MIQPRLSLIFIVLLFVINAVANSQTTKQHVSSLKVQFLAVLDSLHRQYRFPGATAAYILPDGTVGIVATGLADVELNLPMTPQSRMLAASIGKTFAGALVLALVQEGILHIDEPISKWLGNRSWFTRLPNHELITLRQLLTHSSGIPNHVEMDGFQKLFAKNWSSTENPPPPDSLIAFVLDQPPFFKPGQGWYYSDTGYILVGLIIEQVTGRSYYEQINQRFLTPLRLTLTTPSDSPELAGLVAGYTAASGFGLPVKTTLRPGVMAWHPGIEWTGGGFISNPGDLVIWAKALFEGRAMEGDYLDELMQSVPISSDDPSNRYGIAVAIRETSPLGPVWGHGGWIPGYSSSVRYYPDHGVAIAFQINTDVGVIDHSTSLIADMENSLAEVVVTSSQD